MGKLVLEIQEIPLTPILQAALESVKPAIEAKSIRVELENRLSSDQVAADPVRLQQILWNLLANSNKFTPNGGWIRMTARNAVFPQNPARQAVEIEITDTGEGIEPQFLPNVFDRFSQADSSMTRSHGGLGLGLAIVKGLVEKHGGAIQAESQGLGKGSTFKVWLPTRKT